MAHIVIINPKFDPSFWGMEHALPIFGVKANMPVACLPLLAALTPDKHSVTLLDENVEPIDFELCARADIVALTGMIVQRARMRDILVELKERGCFTVVGGPWVTVREDYFGNLVDVTFVGEAEESWPRFLAEWEAGRHARRYEQSARTVMSTAPTPRWDKLDMTAYAYGSLQISRGCPFTCEFCDIIVVFGREPRIKTAPQVEAELDALHAARVGSVFVVDDNLIGNKKAIKPLLRAVAAWQRRHDYPLRLVTEASIDLADDPEMIALMVEANIRVVFVGVETPNEASLRETKKLQNVRKGKTLLERIHAIQQGGLEVWSGMILGFDNDDATIFEAQTRFLREARIVNAMVGMLTAIPKTPLYARLEKEGRLDYSDPPEFGTNVIPKKIGRAELKAGFQAVQRELYEPEAYFDRLDSLYLDLRLQPEIAKRRHLRKRPLRFVATQALWLAQAATLFARLMRFAPRGPLRAVYRRRMWKVVRRRPTPIVVLSYALKSAMHYHAHRMMRDMQGARAVVNSF